MSLFGGLLGFATPVSQMAKGLAGYVTGTDLKQTNENFSEDIVDEIRKASVRALEAGRMGTNYEDYDDLPDGTPIGELVRSDKARSDFVKNMAYPQAQAAFSVGRGSLKIEDGKVYFTDKYNFSGSSSNKGDDIYSQVRKVAGKVMTEDEGDTVGNTVEIYLGTEKELLGRKVEKGDTLSKIAKEEDVSVEELAAFNNIEDPNKIKLGQRIKIPTKPEPPKEEVDDLSNPLLAQEDLFRGDIGA